MAKRVEPDSAGFEVRNAITSRGIEPNSICQAFNVSRSARRSRNRSLAATALAAEQTPAATPRRLLRPVPSGFHGEITRSSPTRATTTDSH
jgi:hypothetical protein